MPPPIWAPKYMSADELFESLADKTVADNVQLIVDLYHSYKKIYTYKHNKPLNETLDEFFFFGEILLSDFDDVDKNMVNADALFSNLEDLDRLKDDFSHLTDRQREEIARRFGKAFTGSSELQEAFLNIWDILGDVYRDFKQSLAARRIAYRGMIMRDAAENTALDFSGQQFVFAGFNALSKSEETLFLRMKNSALFYWDSDEYYLNTEAGKHIRNNIIKFGSALDNQPVNNFLSQKKKITYIASPSESGQTGFIPEWLDSTGINPKNTAPDSAIILCNEALLPAVMHSVSPQKTENVNITMGFPVTQTPVAGFLSLLSEMQTAGSGKNNTFHSKYVLPVLQHPYATLLFPEASRTAKKISEENIFYPDINILKNEQIFARTTDAVSLCRYLLEITESVGKASETSGQNISRENVYDGLYKESIFRTWQTLNRLHGLMQTGGWTLEKPAFLRLLRKLLSVTQVPFHGEPVKGLQIMGLLETRSLDFKNLLLLSVNEGFMPSGNTEEKSFIPRFIRRSLGLSTTEREDSIYAYTFYRLIQRAENITLVYSTDKNQTAGKAEMSRFMLQMLVDRRLDIKRYQLQFPVQPMNTPKIEIKKTAELMARIKSLFDFNTSPGSAKPISPSSLNTLIDCPLRFYYKKIEGYATEDEMSEEIDSSVFGTIFHRAAELLYKDIHLHWGNINDKSFEIKPEHLAPLLHNTEHHLEQIITKAFTEIFFNGRKTDISSYNGEQILNFRIISRLLKRLLQFDINRAPFTVLGLEYKISEEYTISIPGTKPQQDIRLKIGGIIDRLEESGGKIMVLDYKTGGKGKQYKDLGELVTASSNRASHIFQTFVYSTILVRSNRFNQPVVPALLYLQEAGTDISPVVLHDGIPVEDFRSIYPDFEPLFLQKAGELFNPDIPFRQTVIKSNCEYCEYRELCKIKK
jgi:hypothetical protein